MDSGLPKLVLPRYRVPIMVQRSHGAEALPGQGHTQFQSTYFASQHLGAPLGEPRKEGALRHVTAQPLSSTPTAQLIFTFIFFTT